MLLVFNSLVFKVECLPWSKYYCSKPFHSHSLKKGGKGGGKKIKIKKKTEQYCESNNRKNTSEDSIKGFSKRILIKIVNSLTLKSNQFLEVMKIRT